MKTYNKLVRDKIPAILLEKSKVHAVHQADFSEFNQKLCQKLQEEVDEFLENPCLEELADIQEVILALVSRNSWSVYDLEHVRKEKLVARGGFEKGFILEYVE